MLYLALVFQCMVHSNDAIMPALNGSMHLMHDVFVMSFSRMPIKSQNKVCSNTLLCCAAFTFLKLSNRANGADNNNNY